MIGRNASHLQLRRVIFHMHDTTVRKEKKK
jgi:hypothetical protein